MRLDEEDLPLRAGVVLYDRNLDVLIVHPTGARKTQWDFPKGHFDDEKDTTLEDTALRELWEETNIHVSDTELNFASCNEHIDGRYNGTKLRLYFLQRGTVDLSGCKCTSLIDGSCPQEWKRGLPENDRFDLVPWTELRDRLYKSYETSGLLSKVEEYFESVDS